MRMRSRRIIADAVRAARRRRAVAVPHSRQPSPSSSAAPSRDLGDAPGEPVVAAHEIGGEQRRRVVLYICSGVPLLLDRAVVQQQDAVGHRQRFALVVRDAQRGQLHADDQLAQPRPRFLAQLRVEVRQRLVQQDHRRVVDERTRERDALLLAARQLVREALRQMAERRAARAPSSRVLTVGRC